MAVWLKFGNVDIGIEHGIVRRAELETLVAMDEAWRAATEDCKAESVRAQRAAEALIADALGQAAAALQDARAAVEARRQEGYEEGRAQALREWHAEAARQREVSAQRLSSRREWLADLVVQAVLKLVRSDGGERYFSRALEVLDGLAEREMLLWIRVSPADVVQARSAIDALRTRWKDGTVVRILEDNDLAAGSCICESAQGWIDASLPLQLEALRTAAMNAMDAIDTAESEQQATVGPETAGPGAAEAVAPAFAGDGTEPEGLQHA